METYKRNRQILADADAGIVGASNGLSITEGLHIFADNAAFEELFGDFRQKYGIRSILQGFFFCWPSEEERWAFLSRLAMHYSGSYQGSPVMDALISLIRDKPYFIVTSNGENHFELAGLNPDRILEIEGSWKEFVCSAGCNTDRISSWEHLARMHEAEQDGKIPSDLILRCPHCNAPMRFPSEPEQKRVEAFQSFVKEYHNRKLVVLELGIGARNQLIKAPLMQLVYREPESFYITFNKGEIYIPAQIQERSIGVDGDLGEILPRLADGTC